MNTATPTFPARWKTADHLMRAVMRRIKKTKPEAAMERGNWKYTVKVDGQNVQVCPRAQDRFYGGTPMKVRGAKVSDGLYRENARVYVPALKDQASVPDKIADAVLLVAAKMKGDSNPAKKMPLHYLRSPGSALSHQQRRRKTLRDFIAAMGVPRRMVK